MNAYLTSVIENVKKKHSNEPEFVQTVEEVFSLYYRVVVIRAPLQGLCYTVKDAVDWLRPPTTRWFQKGSNHSPLQFC